MQYLTLYTPARRTGPPTPEGMAAMGKLIEDMSKAGILVATGGFSTGATGAMAKLADGKFTLTNGAPAFPEAGFAILQTNTKEALSDALHQFLKIAGDGTCEVRPLMGPPPK